MDRESDDKIAIIIDDICPCILGIIYFCYTFFKSILYIMSFGSIFKSIGRSVGNVFKKESRVVGSFARKEFNKGVDALPS